MSTMQLQTTGVVMGKMAKGTTLENIFRDSFFFFFFKGRNLIKIVPYSCAY